MSGAYATSRLRFEPLRLEHADALAAALCDPRVNAHFLSASPADAAALREDFAVKVAGSPHGGERWMDFAVRLGDAWIGRVEATVQDGHAEIAYLLGPAWWGRGLGREAAGWIARWCVAEGVETLWGTVAPSNVRSARVLRALGFERVDVPRSPRLTSYDPGDLVFRCAAGELAGERAAEVADVALGHW